MNDVLSKFQAAQKSNADDVQTWADKATQDAFRITPSFTDPSFEEKAGLSGRERLVFRLLAHTRSFASLIQLNIVPAEQLSLFLYRLEHCGLLLRKIQSEARAIETNEVKIIQQTLVAEHRAATPSESPEAKLFRRKVKDFYSRCKNEDHFTLLGVKPDVDEATLLTTHRDLIKAFHPDRALPFMRNADDQLQVACERIVSNLNAIIKELRSPESKEAYINELRDAQMAKVDKAPEGIESNDPNVLFALAKKAFEENNIRVAEDLATKASVLSGRDTRFEAFRIWCFYLARRDKSKGVAFDATRSLKALLARDDRADIAYMLHRIALDENDPAAALRFAQMTLQRDAEHVEAKAFVNKMSARTTQLKAITLDQLES